MPLSLKKTEQTIIDAFKMGKLKINFRTSFNPETRDVENVLSAMQLPFE
jgi:hypothetical protein